MNRVETALRLTKDAKSLGNYDSNVIGMAAEVIAEEDLGLIKTPRGTKTIDGHIFLDGESRSVQVKAWSCMRIRKYRENTFFRIQNAGSPDFLAVILIFSEIPEYEILYFGKSDAVGKLEKNGLSRTIKLSHLKDKGEIKEIIKKIESAELPEENSLSKTRINVMTRIDASLQMEAIISRAIRTSDVRIEGGLTSPRSYGVFRVKNASTSRKFRFGNYPVRMRELEQEFGACVLMYLFRNRDDAQTLASLLNQS